VFVAADVHYLRSGGARAAAVIAGDAAFSAVQAEWTVLVPAALPYQPGQFFLRELPPLRAVLAPVRNLGLLVIDGYVDLDPDGRPGLGAHAHAAFGVPVIGLAKTRFRTASHAVEVLRGNSARPLFVTAAGMPLAQAAELTRQMAGPFRLPDAMRRADFLARTGRQRTDAVRPNRMTRTDTTRGMSGCVP
jgi:deoxyribonuclease V